MKETKHNFTNEEIRSSTAIANKAPQSVSQIARSSHIEYLKSTDIGGELGIIHSFNDAFTMSLGKSPVSDIANFILFQSRRLYNDAIVGTITIEYAIPLAEWAYDYAFAVDSLHQLAESAREESESERRLLMKAYKENVTNAASKYATTSEEEDMLISDTQRVIALMTKTIFRPNKHVVDLVKNESFIEYQ